ncbi:anaphase-promoting complex subunit 11 isoform X1 [Haemorhous mexicanus]|uniref:anaphase-promoting complex subunit 11 isoform X1 n=1 Tax=Haemorhous mexicanus TaxID=30427 RepID=UPI0028BE6DF6|nr:anaphase-promoting complex subunit 11 isoform X1 [Haemorhous mexicanus]XP_059720383.1 anaphase-promoting complex subunit 11 isoform X1 [Haemorhous mexicanus]XP_059720384.1 anaphase-promoting complex subunit 11 isoform X1 [Haemorhous mexicanus]XP_059720385.1 anaphase-promoting complex subunit 11 isoform X1 [Haemorhous mexicanus]
MLPPRVPEPPQPRGALQRAAEQGAGGGCPCLQPALPAQPPSPRCAGAPAGAVCDRCGCGAARSSPVQGRPDSVPGPRGVCGCLSGAGGSGVTINLLGMALSCLSLLGRGEPTQTWELWAAELSSPSYGAEAAQVPSRTKSPGREAAQDSWELQGTVQGQQGEGAVQGVCRPGAPFPVCPQRPCSPFVLQGTWHSLCPGLGQLWQQDTDWGAVGWQLIPGRGTPGSPPPHRVSPQHTSSLAAVPMPVLVPGPAWPPGLLCSLEHSQGVPPLPPLPLAVALTNMDLPCCASQNPGRASRAEWWLPWG